MGIRNYFYSRSLRKFADYINGLLANDSCYGIVFYYSVRDYYHKHFSVRDGGLRKILSNVEEKHHVFSDYFTSHYSEYIPVVKEFGSDSGYLMCYWLSVSRMEFSEYRVRYVADAFEKRFGVRYYLNSLWQNGFEEFICCLYRKVYKLDEYDITDAKVGYVYIKDEEGNEYRVKGSVPEIETKLLRNGFCLLRETDSLLIYSRSK